MKFILHLYLIFIPVLGLAQPGFPGLQNNWLEEIKSGQPASGFYWEGRNLIFAKVESAQPESFYQLLNSGEIPELKGYEHEQVLRHDDIRYISVGKIITADKNLMLLTGWRKIENSWKKEIDIILTQTGDNISDELIIRLDQAREKWVELANQHQPEIHITELYTPDAVYFGNGQKSEGRSEIAERYVYMKNPNYRVALKKENLWNITEEKVLETGRYFVGTEPHGSGGLYIILWEKQEKNIWQIALDFNF